MRRIAIAAFVYLSLLPAAVFARSSLPEINGISPTSGPEGSRVEITGKNLEDPSAVLFGTIRAVFKSASAQGLVVLVPHKVSTSTITVITPRGRATTPFPFVISNDPRVPDEVGYKTGYVNPVPPPADFHSALLWGIAIADTRIAGFESAHVEVAWTQLSCRVGGQDVVLNDDTGKVRGGLYRRKPWFGTDVHEPMPMAHANILWDRVSDPVLPRSGSGRSDHAVILPVGERTDRVWHFWSASPRAALPSGNLQGCTVKPASRFLQEPCCKWGWTTGVPRPYLTAPAEITTKPAPATGISPRRIGKKHRSPTSAARSSRYLL